MLPQSFSLGLGAGLSSDSLQEAAPGAVHRVLLMGKKPEQVPSGLQVRSHVGRAGGTLPRQTWVTTPSLLAARAVVLSSEPADPHLHLRVTCFAGRRPALLPPGLAGLPDGQYTGWSIGWEFRPPSPQRIFSWSGLSSAELAAMVWHPGCLGPALCIALVMSVPARSVWKPYSRAARWFVPCSRGPLRA